MGVIDDMPRDTSEEEAPDRTAGVATDDDEIGAFGLGSIDHGRSGVALPDEELSSDDECRGVATLLARADSRWARTWSTRA